MNWRAGIVLTAVLWASPAFAVSVWKTDPAKSELKFVATQNSSPVEGQFKSFTPTIMFDAKDLANSKISVDVDLTSVSASYEEMASTLKTADWFNVAQFATAHFESTAITPVTGEANTFSAAGNLTLRGKTLPVTLIFALDDPNAATVVATGKVTLMRNDFGVGQGEWAKSDAVKNEVAVHFRVTATRNP